VSLNKDSSDIGIVVVTFILQNPVKSAVFPHRNVHKYTSISSEGKTQSVWSLIDRWEMAFIYTRCAIFQGSWLWLLIATWWLQKLRERLAVDKQAAQNINIKRFNLKKLGELEVRKLSD